MNLLKKTNIRFFIFSIVVCLAISVSLHAGTLDDKPTRPNFKTRINDFIKDVVSDIVSVSSQNNEQASAATAPKVSSPFTQTPLQSVKTVSGNSTATALVTAGLAPLSANVALANHPHEIIVIDHILYIDEQPATAARIEALKEAGVEIGNDLLRYMPIADPQPAAAKSKINIVSMPAKVAEKHLPPVENVRFKVDKTIAESIAEATAVLPKPIVSNATANVDKVVLADIYDEAIPCNYHYDDNWNTKNIHPYRYNLTQMPETVVFLLTHGLGGDFSLPIEGHARVTSGFGPRWGKHHNGIDLDLETGDHVNAAFAGRVRIAQYSNSFGYVVVVRHYNGLETTYAHLSKLLVQPNQDVIAGTLIGLGGNTGRSSGSHLHFEVRYKGHPMNPREMIDFERNTLKSNTFIIDKSYFSSSNPYEDAHELGAVSEVSHSHSTASRATTTRAIAASRYHTVKKGDTISEIADKYNVSVQKVCSLNKLSAKTTLKPGRKLRVK